ncbi:hypothetical protein TNCV_3992291 [Trichonephila clavipes]|uniref:Uncharacterized protein n=1 Tax=Trichonephila clavipes TaxID=2585209 RepID=A0A8X6VT62_TRICX|nr:hypothetical protein TNCV_3992291 [Trichonephila clavipes]
MKLKSLSVKNDHDEMDLPFDPPISRRTLLSDPSLPKSRDFQSLNTSHDAQKGLRRARKKIALIDPHWHSNEKCPSHFKIKRKKNKNIKADSKSKRRLRLEGVKRKDLIKILIKEETS